jgi:hypothetical protein
MSSFSKKRKFRPYWAFDARVQLLADEYEQRLGCLPVWLHELDSERVGPLLECCIRIGMQLTIGDALEADDAERRAQAKNGIRRPRSDP